MKLLGNWNYQIAYVAPPISEVIKVYRCNADSDEIALQKLTDFLGHAPEEYHIEKREDVA